VRRVILSGVLAGAALFGGAAVAQDSTVEVRTWTGQSFKLVSATFEIFYTIVPPPPPGAEAAPTLPTSQGGVGQVTTIVASAPQPPIRSRMEGSLVLPQEGPDAKQGRRRQDVIAVFRDQIEIRVPLATVSEVTFSRHSVNSTLPSYFARDHFRHAATLKLADGSTIVGDYVNLGTAILRGTTAEGTVDIPWHQIEFLRFQR
jgi:hypothetical protein